MKSGWTLHILTVACFIASVPTALTVTADGDTPQSVSHPLYGVTVASIDPLADIVDALSALSRKPTIRLVFDEYIPPEEYVDAVNSLRDVSYVMGEVLDSMYVKQYSIKAYTDRTIDYLNTFGSKVDIWEIANEVNGAWLGETPAVVAKMTNAHNLVKKAGGKSAITLYYNEDCWMYPTEEMFRWAEKNIPHSMKQELDYVFVSYYEDDCNDLQPNWPVVFRRLAAMFPDSMLGFGEIGTKFVERKEKYINRYYTMIINEKNYVGGYFWWYFNDDMVPKTTHLWSVLNNAIGKAHERTDNSDCLHRRCREQGISHLRTLNSGPTTRLSGQVHLGFNAY